MEFREHTLDNGLEIIAECNPNAYSTAIAFFVRTGARDETDEIWGVSHFLEHMAFKGTPTRSAADVNRELDEIGSAANAFTSEEQTVYHATVLPEYQDRALEILADMMRPSLCEDEFDTEKKVILEEIAKYNDQPPFGAYEKCMALYFGRHALSRSVLGTVKSVGGLSVEQMRAYFQDRYGPSNLTLAAAGNVDFERFVEKAKGHCGNWISTPCERETPRAPANRTSELIQKDIAAQQYVVQIAAGPAAEDDDRFSARILSTILGDDSGSRIFWELIDSGLAEYAGMVPYEYQGTGIMMTYLCCAPEDAEQNLELIHKIQQDLETNGVTEKELAQAKSKICSQIVLRAERPGNRLFSIGNNWIQRKNYRTVRQSLDSYQAVTSEDVARVLQERPLTENTNVAVGPLKELAFLS